MIVAAQFADGYKVSYTGICQIDYCGHYIRCAKKIEWFAIFFNDIKHGRLVQFHVIRD